MKSDLTFLSKPGHNNEVLPLVSEKWAPPGGITSAYGWTSFQPRPRGLGPSVCWGLHCFTFLFRALLLLFNGIEQACLFLKYFISLYLIGNMYKICLKPKAPEKLGNFFLNLCVRQKNSIASLIK